MTFWAETLEVVTYKHERDDLFFRTSQIYNINGEFTGIIKIERRLKNGPMVIKYAFNGACYDTIKEAMAEFRNVGCIARNKRGRKQK